MVVDGINTTLFDYRSALASEDTLNSLETYVSSLAEHGVNEALECLSLKGQIAFWVNAYNGLIVHYVLRHARGDLVPVSIRDLSSDACADDTVWSCRAGIIGGEPMTLEAVEGRAKALGDPRIHAAINCASL